MWYMMYPSNNCFSFVQVVGYSSDLYPLQRFVAYVREFVRGGARLVTTPLDHALHQLEVEQQSLSEEHSEDEDAGN